MTSENWHTPPLLNISKFATRTKHSARSNVPNQNRNNYKKNNHKVFTFFKRKPAAKYTSVL